MSQIKMMKSILQKYKISPRKELGQHFIKDLNLLKRELKYANINKNDTVLEVGPGIGNLTELLAQKAKQVIAIEKDSQFKKCLTELQEKYANIKVIWGDALEVKFPNFNKVVSNLPFKIALPLTFKLLKYNFNLALLLYQERLARRMSAPVGRKGYSRISVQIYRTADVKILETVPKKAFYPSPEIPGAIVKIKKTKPKFKIPSVDFFRRALDFFFFPKTQTVKQAILNLRSIGIQEKKLNKILLELKRMQNKRVYQITPKQFGKIAEILYKNKINIPEIPEELKRKVQKFKRPAKLLNFNRYFNK